MSFFTATSHQNRHPHRNHCDHWNHHDNRNHCDDCNHLNLQVQAANTGPAKYKGLTDVVFSLYRFAPFKFLIHLILCIIVVSIMTTTNFPLSATTTTITTTSSSSSWPPPCPPEIKRLKDKEEKTGRVVWEASSKGVLQLLQEVSAVFQELCFFLIFPIFCLLMFFLHGSIQTELYWYPFLNSFTHFIHIDGDNILIGGWVTKAYFLYNLSICGAKRGGQAMASQQNIGVRS